MLFSSKKSAFDYLIVGLGNPGLQYEQTRHNAGFMAIDRIAKNAGAEFIRHKHDSVFTEAEISGKRVLLAKPQTFMNLSGKAVLALSSFYKIPIDNIIILFDDISLDVGKIRIRRKGSAGGHNGIKDIIELLGTEEIARIKIGVGAKPSADYDLKDWVLGKISPDKSEAFSNALDCTEKAVKEILAKGIDSAMNKYSK